MKTFEHWPRDTLTGKDVDTLKELTVVQDSLSWVKSEVLLLNDEVRKLIEAINQWWIDEFFKELEEIQKKSSPDELKNIAMSLVKSSAFNTVVSLLSPIDKVSFSFEIWYYIWWELDITNMYIDNLNFKERVKYIDTICSIYKTRWASIYWRSRIIQYLTKDYIKWSVEIWGKINNLIKTFWKDFFDGIPDSYPLFVNVVLDNILHVDKEEFEVLFEEYFYERDSYLTTYDKTNFGELCVWKIWLDRIKSKKWHVWEMKLFYSYWILSIEDVIIFANLYKSDEEYVHEILRWLNLPPQFIQETLWEVYIKKRISYLINKLDALYLSYFIAKNYEFWSTQEELIIDILDTKSLSLLDKEYLEERVKFLEWVFQNKQNVLSVSDYVLLTDIEKTEYLSIYEGLYDTWTSIEKYTKARFEYFEIEWNEEIKWNMIELFCENFYQSWLIEEVYESIILESVKWKEESYMSLFDAIFNDKMIFNISDTGYYFPRLSWHIFSVFNQITNKKTQLFSDILNYSDFFRFDSNLLDWLIILHSYITASIQQWKNESVVQELHIKYNKLSIELLWKIPPIEFQSSMLWSIDWSGDNWELIDIYILWHTAYKEKKVGIAKILNALPIQSHEIHESNLNTLMRYDPDEKFYEELLSQRLWYLFILFGDDSVVLEFGNERWTLSDDFRDRIELELLNYMSQKEWREKNNEKAHLKFLKYANEFDILVDPSIFIRFENKWNTSIETSNAMILEFLKWIDTDRLGEYESKFSLWGINSIVDMLVYYMNHNIDEIRKLATQKFNSSGRKTSVQEYRDQLRVEDYGWTTAKDKLAWANNSVTRTKIEWIDGVKFSEWATQGETNYYEAVQNATQQMSKTKILVWWELQEEIPDIWHLSDQEQELKDTMDETIFFVEKLQKYALAELYMFIGEQNCSDEFIQTVTEYFDSDIYTGVILFSNEAERRLAWHSMSALWIASLENWNTSIALNLALIAKSLWNESKNETKSLYDAITDVYLHEFFHIVDYSKKWEQEDEFDKVKYNEVNLEEVMTEIYSTYLERLWNEQELKDITKLWEWKWIKSISFLQFLNEWYEDWSDDFQLLEFFERTRKEWKLWYMLEVFVNGNIDECKRLINDVFENSDPQKTWRDIIPWL